jgi:hypothetical protein
LAILCLAAIAAGLVVLTQQGAGAAPIEAADTVRYRTAEAQPIASAPLASRTELPVPAAANEAGKVGDPSSQKQWLLGPDITSLVGKRASAEWATAFETGAKVDPEVARITVEGFAALVKIDAELRKDPSAEQAATSKQLASDDLVFALMRELPSFVANGLIRVSVTNLEVPTFGTSCDLAIDFRGPCLSWLIQNAHMQVRYEIPRNVGRDELWLALLKPTPK